MAPLWICDVNSSFHHMNDTPFLISLYFENDSQFKKFGPLKCNQLKQPTSHTSLLGFLFIKDQKKNSALTHYWLVSVWSLQFMILLSFLKIRANIS